MSKYHRWYNSIMDRAKGRELDDYCEQHHVRPRSLGGSDSKRNIVKLTYREHFLAHWLLVKFTRGIARRKMLHALAQMTTPRVDKRIVSGWQYDVSKRARADALRGKKFSRNHIANLSASWTEERKTNHAIKTVGRKRSPEIVAKLKASRTEEVRARISKSLTGRKRIGFVPWNKGNKMPADYGAKRSLALKKYHQSHTST